MAFNDQLLSAKQTTMNFFRKLVIGLVLFLVLSLGISYLLTRFPYSEGERAGVVSKLSKTENTNSPKFLVPKLPKKENSFMDLEHILTLDEQI